MRKTSSVLLAFLAAVVVIPAPGLAGETDNWAVLSEARGLSQGWKSFTVRTGGGRFAVKIHDEGFTSPVTYGFALYQEDGAPIAAVGFSAYYATTGVFFQSTVPDPPVRVEHEVDRYSNSTGGGGFTPVATPSGSGTFKVLVWAAARQLRAWNYSLRAEDAGVAVLATDSGSGSFIYESNDFSGVAQADAAVVGAGARASVAAQKHLQVRDTLFAWYLQPMVAGCCQANTFVSPNVNAMSVTTPQGEQDCLLGCTLWSFKDGERNGPGEYVFNLSGAGASPISSGRHVSLIGVDARLPA